jgi:molybdopterin/thiamine biosynthesis adenylyltransferase
MPAPPRYFARVPPSVNFSLLQSKLVVVVGLGMVGSPIAEKLARSAVGRLRFIDDDILETENLGRHVLPMEYVDNVQPWNKAEGMAHYLAKQVEGLHTEAIPRKVDELVPDDLLDAWLRDADLIVAATDDREAQRRIGVRALALGIPAIFPALYPRDGGGEIILQLDHEWPCFGCWDYFRTNTEQLRGVNALELAGEPVIHTSVRLCVSILDPDSEHKDMMKGDPGDPPNQVFMLDDTEELRSGPIPWRDHCPSCGGPTPLRTDAVDARHMFDRTRSIDISVSQSSEMSTWALRSATQTNHVQKSFDFSDWLGGSVCGTLLMLLPSAFIVSEIDHTASTEAGHFSVGLWLVLSVILGVIVNGFFYLKEWAGKQ